MKDLAVYLVIISLIIIVCCTIGFIGNHFKLLEFGVYIGIGLLMLGSGYLITKKLDKKY